MSIRASVCLAVCVAALPAAGRQTVSPPPGFTALYNGRDLAGWLRLVNAYAVLDRKDDARAAIARARQHFPADEKALGELAALAKSLGLGS